MSAPTEDPIVVTGDFLGDTGFSPEKKSRPQLSKLHYQDDQPLKLRYHRNVSSIEDLVRAVNWEATWYPTAIAISSLNREEAVLRFLIAHAAKWESLEAQAVAVAAEKVIAARPNAGDRLEVDFAPLVEAFLKRGVFFHVRGVKTGGQVLALFDCERTITLAPLGVTTLFPDGADKIQPHIQFVAGAWRPTFSWTDCGDFVAATDAGLNLEAKRIQSFLRNGSSAATVQVFGDAIPEAIIAGVTGVQIFRKWQKGNLDQADEALIENEVRIASTATSCEAYGVYEIIRGALYHAQITESGRLELDKASLRPSTSTGLQFLERALEANSDNYLKGPIQTITNRMRDSSIQGDLSFASAAAGSVVSACRDEDISGLCAEVVAATRTFLDSWF